MRDDTDSIAASTALLRNRRAEGAGRFDMNRGSVKESRGARVTDAIAPVALRRKRRRENGVLKVINHSLG
jgi:hypothetical protein